VVFDECLMSFAQTSPEGVFKGYAGEWDHVSEQLIALAEATPQDKFTWRPAAGVRSTSEVNIHIAHANFLLLSATGPKMPSEFKDELVTTVTTKADVIRWVKRSLEAVREAHAAERPEDLHRKARVFNTDATVDGIFLRIIIHNNEHMGQLVAYAG
jgi:uncharacterized damage-inducible protein DinB